MAQRKSSGQHSGRGSGGGKNKIWKWIGIGLLVWYLIQSGVLQTNGSIGDGQYRAPTHNTGPCTQYFKGGC